MLILVTSSSYSYNTENLFKNHSSFPLTEKIGPQKFPRNIKFINCVVYEFVKCGGKWVGECHSPSISLPRK